MYKGRLFTVLFLIFAFGLAACTSPLLYHTSDTAIKATDNKIQVSKERNEVPPPPVVTKAEPYVDTHPVSFKREPGWLKNRITVHGEQLPFALFMSKILSGTDSIVNYQASFDRHQLISFNYQGTIKGALNRLAAKTKTVYDVDKGTVFWKNLITKRFNVSFMPGTTDYLLGRKSGGGLDSSGGGGTQTVTAKSSSDEYSNMTGAVSLWTDLENTMKNLISPVGKIVISQSTTSITVTDQVDNVNAIENYLNGLNEDLSRQVLLKVVVLDVDTLKEFSHGIDWDLIRRDLIGKTFELNGGFGDLLKSVDSGFSTFSFVRDEGRSMGSKVLISALEEQANVSVVTSPQVTTLNNQVAEINITTQTAYAASIETTLNDNQSQTAINPGIVQDGFTLFALPKIQGDKIYLQITTSLSNLDQISEFGSGDTRIQTPVLSEKYFNQRTMLKTGETLVMAGFRGVENRANKAAHFGVDSLGGKGANHENTETLLLITPYIVWGDHHPHAMTDMSVKEQYS